MRKMIGVAVAVLALLLAPDAAAQSGPQMQGPAATASDGPGALSHFDLARKDCAGTAQNTGTFESKVWFTLANGVVSDVYYPTIDNTNVETLQYIVSDGSTFTDLQTRDTTYTADIADPHGRALDCTITTTAKSGKYRIVTDYVTDPDSNTLLMSSKFQPLVGKLSAYQLYVRFDPSINGNGGGGDLAKENAGADSSTVDSSTGHLVPIAFDTQTATNAANRTYAVPVYSALDSARPFLQVSNGFVGKPSDGLVQLDASHHLSNLYGEANNGNVVETAQVDLSRGGKFELALGFGQSQPQAVRTAEGALHAPFGEIQSRYERGWQQYDDSLTAPPANLAGIQTSLWHDLVDEYYLSTNAARASVDKTFPGALIASLASPWGQAVSAGDPNNTYFGSYREVFARDAYEAWTGLLLAGDTQTARDIADFLLHRQQKPDGSMPRNSLVNGQAAPDTFNTQLDETSYPLLMADQLHMTDANLYQQHVALGADFVIGNGPSFGPERWEEQSGYSPSTIAAEIAGLISAAHIADANGDAPGARVFRGVADDWQRSVKRWTVTTNGPQLSQPYFIRLSKTGDPNAAIRYNVGNGGPTLDQREVIDAGFLELVRLGELPADDPDVVRSLPVVDKVIGSTTASGQGWHRYNGDGYGDGASDGHPWAPKDIGTGHLWPVLSEERGEFALANGDRATALRLLGTMRAFASGVGLIPEQDWELQNLPASPYGTDPTIASIGFLNGHPAGSAAPLTWAAGVYPRLIRDIVESKLLDRPTTTYQRYVASKQGETSLDVSDPPAGAPTLISTASITVAGTSKPGNTIDVAATNTDHNSQTTITTGTTAKDGKFSLQVPVGPGTTVLNIVATEGTVATAHAARTVFSSFVPGTLIFDAADPTGDDNGPGNYAYPTSADFHAGAFDMQDFQVFDSGSDITFRVLIRDLSPTFGSPLGAQLVDVYVHDPDAAATDTSTAASFPQRNYVIAPSSAWSRLIEVQGFGQRYVDAHGNTLGTVNISASAISRYIMFSVSKASLGTPGPGWGFTVVLTGQDGFSPDQARGFAPTPQPFQFGVCAAPSTDPHCITDQATINATVPKAVDIVTPAGVSQSDELDYTKHNPVVLQDVTIP